MTAGTISTADPKGATQLAILGVLARAPALGTEIVSLVKHIVGRSWQPTSDVIAVTLSELRRRGLVEPDGEGERSWDTTRYAVTDQGRQILDSLLRQPVGLTAAGLDTAGIALKVCFMDLLEPPAQAEQIDAIVAAYEAAIGHFRYAVERCACDWTYVSAWIAMDADRLERERDWFRSLKAGLRQSEPVLTR